jgi:multidrug resistance efflux pump
VPDIGGHEGVDVIEVTVKAGDRVEVEQTLITLETDKASMEVPATAAGVVKEVKVKVGDKISEGGVILLLEAADAAQAAPAPAAAPAPVAAAPAPVAAPAPASAPAVVAAAAETGYKYPHASPSVRLFARQQGVDLRLVKGSHIVLERNPNYWDKPKPYLDKVIVRFIPDAVARAAARVRESYLALSRATLPAPVAGYVAKRGVQVGQRVQPGAPLMAIVPLNSLWVDANFKESQLAGMRIGQPVTLHADIYGGSVTYHGKVAGLGAGTGGVFSLLPAQNATGNWIKVVQRVPVRITLDPKELSEHPLRVGLSMLAEVDQHDQSGPALATAPRQAPAQSTTAFAGADQAAQARIARIIADNLGKDRS